MVGVSCFVSSFAKAAACPAPSFTDPKNVKLKEGKFLLVTHPSSQWDGRFSSKAGMDSAIRFAKTNALQVVYLQDPDLKETNSTYFFSDCQPDYWVSSDGGEFSFSVPSQVVYAVGGHWELCQNQSVDNLLQAWSKMPLMDRTVYQVMDGIYSFGVKFERQDPWYEDFRRFMEIIGYASTRPSSRFAKMTLSEALGIIKDSEGQKKFLARTHYQTQGLDPKYRVELRLYGQTFEVLQPGLGSDAPVIAIDYIASLYKDGFDNAKVLGTKIQK